MKVAALADLHLYGPRLDEQTRVLDEVATSIAKSGAELLLIAGDLTGKTSPHRATPAERNALLDFLDKVECPTVIVRGNHDYPGDWDVLNRLASDVYYSDQPERLDGDGWSVICLPWIDKADVRDAGSYSAGVRDLYASFIRELDSVGPNAFVLAHAAVSDAMIREGQPIVATDDPLLSPDLLAIPGARAVLLGHYHHHQILECDVPACYIGSANYWEHGEPGPKGWALWDGRRLVHNAIDQPMRYAAHITHDGRLLALKPHVKPMPARLTEAPWKGDESLSLHVSIPSKDQWPIAQATVKDLSVRLADKIAELRVDWDVEITTKSREGADKIAEAKDLPRKVERYLRGQTNAAKKDIDRASELLSKVLSELFMEAS